MSMPRLAPCALAACTLVSLALSLSACSNDDGSVGTPPVPQDLREKYALEPFSYADLPYPGGNNPSNAGYADRVELGRLLFFDHELAGRRDISCGTCHHPALAWADARPLGAGVSGIGLGPDRVLQDSRIEPMPRNVPTNMNVGMNSALPGGPPDARGMIFWDSRERGLEAQAIQPCGTIDEMSYHLAIYDEPTYADSVAADSVAARLRRIPEYVDRFRAAFPVEAAEMDAAPGDPAHHAIRKGTMERALAAYQRELIALDSPYERYVGGEDDALNAAQLRGLDLFYGRARCADCHNGPMLSDFSMSRTGVKHDSPGRDPRSRNGLGRDQGLAEHTSRPDDLYKYRVPSLRNTELTGPWFRHGVAQNLREVVVLKIAAGIRPSDPERAEIFDRLYDTRLSHDALDPRLVPVALTDAEVDDLVAFMQSLTARSIDSPFIDPTVPERVPSGLPTVQRLEPFSLVPLPQHTVPR